MPFTHTSRRGKVYYIRAYRTKTGKDAWAMTAKPKGCVLADAVPDGFEVYEEPNGMVFLRRTVESLIRPDEVETVRTILARQKHLKPIDTKIALEKKTLTIHLLDREDDHMLEMSRRVLGAWFGTDEYLAKRGTYTAMMRLTLQDAKERLFLMERYCFRGSIDSWIEIGNDEPLAKLAERFLLHLGKQSFYEIGTGGFINR